MSPYFFFDEEPEIQTPVELFRSVRHLEAAALRLVESVFTGEYQSVFRGQGIEFAEVRPYEPGDDIRFIDWNVSARMGQPYVKRYVEERESVLLLVVDVSGSLRVGSRVRKSRTAAEIAAVLALTAVRNNDRVGLVLVSDRVELYVPPRKGRRHALRVVREILSARPESRLTDLTPALDLIVRVGRRRWNVFLISDFHARDYGTALKRVRARHDVVAFEVRDRLEREIPAVGVVRWLDAESGERHTTVAGSLATEDAAREELFRRLRIDRVTFWAGDSVVEPLHAFFRRRERRRLHTSA